MDIAIFVNINLIYREMDHMHLFLKSFFFSSSAAQRAKLYGPNIKDVQEYQSVYIKKNSHF